MLAHPDFPLPPDIQESFLPQYMILDYLENFARHFQLYDFIKVSYQVRYSNEETENNCVLD